jgi:RNA polymerase sigma-70 factor (ECF subfamily)
MFEQLRGKHQSKDQSGSLSDAALHKAAIAGSGEAMAELYRRHGGLVYRFTLRMSRDASIAEEITQEVFLALLSQVGGSDPYDVARAALPTWLCGIARRQLWKHLGRFDDVMDDEDAPEVESPEDSPVTRLMRQEAVALVRQGLDELPLPLKEVIVLCELEEMSYEETALVLGAPIGTVRSRLHRAKARLASLLRGEAVSVRSENDR